MPDPTKVYKYALFLPILVPILVAPILYFGLQSLGEKLGLIVIIIFYSGVIGGIPYLIIGVALAVWMRGKSEDQIRRALLFSPPMMIGVTSILYTLLWLIPGNSNGLNSLGSFLWPLVILSLFIGLFGYAYVGISFGIARIVRGGPYEPLPG
jgi:hypothetical protein